MIKLLPIGLIILAASCGADPETVEKTMAPAHHLQRIHIVGLNNINQLEVILKINRLVKAEKFFDDTLDLCYEYDTNEYNKLSRQLFDHLRGVFDSTVVLKNNDGYLKIELDNYSYTFPGQYAKRGIYEDENGLKGFTLFGEEKDAFDSIPGMTIRGTDAYTQPAAGKGLMTDGNVNYHYRVSLYSHSCELKRSAEFDVSFPAYVVIPASQQPALRNL